MNVLILYRSYSGNTEKLAHLIAASLTHGGNASTVQDLRKRLPEAQSFDCVLMGAPTRMAGVTGRALGALKRLKKGGFAHKPIGFFDTYGPLPTNPQDLEAGRKWLYPGAVGKMLEAARKLGLRAHPETLRSTVTGLKGPLADDSPAAADSFVKNFLAAVAR